MGPRAPRHDQTPSRPCFRRRIGAVDQGEGPKRTAGSTTPETTGPRWRDDCVCGEEREAGPQAACRKTRFRHSRGGRARLDGFWCRGPAFLRGDIVFLFCYIRFWSIYRTGPAPPPYRWSAAPLVRPAASMPRAGTRRRTKKGPARRATPAMLGGRKSCVRRARPSRARPRTMAKGYAGRSSVGSTDRRQERRTFASGGQGRPTPLDRERTNREITRKSARAGAGRRACHITRGAIAGASAGPPRRRKALAQRGRRADTEKMLARPSGRKKEVTARCGAPRAHNLRPAPGRPPGCRSRPFGITGPVETCGGEILLRGEQLCCKNKPQVGENAVGGAQGGGKTKRPPKPPLAA